MLDAVEVSSMSAALDPLTASEIRLARSLILAARADLDDPGFPLLVLDEPARALVLGGADPERIGRRARVTVLERGSGRVIEAVVAPPGGDGGGWSPVGQGEPPLLGGGDAVGG